MKPTHLSLRLSASLALAFALSAAPFTSQAQSTYAGMFEGTFSGNGDNGVFMVMSRASGTATMLIFVDGGGHERKLSFPVSSKNGSFSFRTDEWASLVTGTLNPAQGTYDSEFDGTGVGSGELLPFTGPETASAGYYKGTYKGSGGSGSIWALLSPNGRLIAVYDDPDGGGGALGSLDADGTIIWDGIMSANLSITALLNRATLTISGLADDGDGLVAFTLKRSETAPAKPIVITRQPEHKIVGTRQPISLELEADIDETTTVQWQKNGKSIPGANTLNLDIEQAALTDAGAWRVVLKNKWGTVTSAVAEVTVVDSAMRAVEVFSESPKSPKFVLAVRAAGKITGYSWSRMSGPGLARQGFLVTGANTGTLTITPNAPLEAPQDLDVYTCTISGPGGTLESGKFNVLVLGTMSPAFAPMELPEARVGFFYETRLSSFSYESRARTWKVKTGSTLPSGLALSSDGRLSGVPRTVKTSFPGHSFTIQGTNRQGTTEQTFNLLVREQGESVAGIYAGVVPRSENFNGGLGGRIDLTVSATGGLSGKLALGAATYPIAGTLASIEGGLMRELLVKTTGVARYPSIILSIMRSPPPVDNVVVELRQDTGDPMDFGTPIFIILVRCPFSSANPVPSLPGRYHLGLPSSSEDETEGPEGSGYATLILSSAGACTWGGRLADGVTITGTAPLDGESKIFLHQMLYTNTGSLQGELDLISSPPMPTASGELSWVKLSQITATTNYPVGFDLSLMAEGGRYDKTIPLTTQLGLTSGSLNALAVFSLGELGPDNISQSFTLAGTGTGTFLTANPNLVSLKIDPATGIITAAMTVKGVSTALNRKASASGLVIPGDPGYASAHFLLPKPAVAGEGSPQILSGKLDITPGGAP